MLLLPIMRSNLSVAGHFFGKAAARSANVEQTTTIEPWIAESERRAVHNDGRVAGIDDDAAFADPTPPIEDDAEGPLGATAPIDDDVEMADLDAVGMREAMTRLDDDQLRGEEELRRLLGVMDACERGEKELQRQRFEARDAAKRVRREMREREESRQRLREWLARAA